jgi:hypothetical protein
VKSWKKEVQLRLPFLGQVVPNVQEVEMRFYTSIYLAIAGIYLLTASGRIGLSDSVAMFNVTQSIVNEMSFSADPCEVDIVGHPNHCVLGKDGKHYAGFGVVPSIVAVPAAVGGRWLAGLAHLNAQSVMHLSVSMLTALISPLVPVIFALWVRRLGYSRATALLSASVIALASPFWHYAVKGFYSEAYFTLGLVVAGYLVSSSDRSFSPALAGFSFGAACGCRVIGVIMLPAFVLFLALKHKERCRSNRSLLVDIVTFVSAFSICAGLMAWSNYARFGDVTKTGYQLAYPSISSLLATRVFQGMGQLLFNQEVGLLIFMPWAVLVLMGIFSFFHQHKAEALLCGLLFVINFVFFAKYASWHGGMVAGPRFLVPMVPFLLMFLVPQIEWMCNKERIVSRWRLSFGILAGLLVGASFLIQAVGSVYPESRYYVLTRFYEEKPNQPWWTGSIPLASGDFLLKVWRQDGAPEKRAIAVDSDFASVRRQEEAAFASMATISDERQFLGSFPNSMNFLLPDLFLAKIRALGLPNFAFWSYVAFSAGICLFGVLGIKMRDDAAVPQRVLPEVECV